MLKRFPKLIIILIAFYLTALVIYKSISETKDVMKISFLDVGQGDSVLIETPNKNRILYDSGPPGNITAIKLKEKLPLVLSDIDIFIASHPDADHIGGFVDILSSIKPRYYVDANTINMTPVFAELEKILDNNKIQRLSAHDGSKIDMGDGVVLNILSPEIYKNSNDINNKSVSILITYVNSRVVLTGDLDEKAENLIVNKYKEGLSANILKAGHHGSKTSTGNNLLNVVNPKYVIVSAAKNNKYGHPNAAMVSRVNAKGVTLLETSKIGTITFECDVNSCTFMKND